MLGIAGLLALSALLIFLQYYFDLDLREVIWGLVLFGFASAMLVYSFAGDGPEWTWFSFAGLLFLLAVLPFWRGYRERVSGKRRKSVADKPLYLYLWLVVFVLMAALRFASR